MSDVLRSAQSQSHSELPPQLINLQEKHQALEVRLDQLNRLVYLTADERFERKRIQKLKLRMKDQMQMLQRN